jgi:predicted dehydrogenase
MKVALVGAGGMARLYRAVYARLPNVQWVLAVDVSERELTACKALGAQRVSTSFADALADEIDMVDISTPNHLHEEQAIAALNAGKHVLLQKPMANNLTAADRILAAAARSKGQLGIYLSSYNNPLVWEIKRLVSGGHLGQIQSVRARDAHPGGFNAKRTPENWRSSRDRTGGGSFIQLSIHAINLIQWWLDAPITEIFAYSANQYSPNIGGDDITTAVAKIEGGRFATFDSGWASDGMMREIYGTKGWLVLRQNDGLLEVELDHPYQSDLLQITEPDKPMQVARPPASEPFDNVDNPLNQQRAFIERVAAGQPLMNTGQVGRRDLAVVVAAYESAKSGKPVKVDQLR